MREQFNTLVSTIKETLGYDSSWSNGTGYFDGAVSGPAAPHLAFGQMAKSVDPKGRRIAILGQGDDGNIVIFDRYSGADSPVVYNAPQCVSPSSGLVGGDGNPTVQEFLIKGLDA